MAVTFASNCNGATVTIRGFSGSIAVGSGGVTNTYTATSAPSSGLLLTALVAGKTINIINFGGSLPTEVAKVTICHRTHATTNPYVQITVSVNSVIGSGGSNGHDTHNSDTAHTTNPTSNGVTPGSGPYDSSFAYVANSKSWGDIIPPFYYASGNYYPGLNWAPEWPVPGSTLQSGSGAYWITDANFGAATTLSTAIASYQSAVALCKATTVNTVQGLYDLEVDSGEVPLADIETEIADLDGGTNPFGGSLPNAAELKRNYKVKTVAASSITRTQAQLNGTLRLLSGGTSTKFEYGTNPSGTLTSTPLVSPPGTASPSAVVTGLACGVTYYFRVIGTDSTGTYVGDFLSFATAACETSAGGTTTPTPTPTPTPSPTPTPILAAPAPPSVTPVKRPETEGVRPGREITLVNGEPRATEKKKNSKWTKVEISSPEFTLVLGGTTPDGKPLSLSPAQAPVVTPQGRLTTSGSGCSPGTVVHLYLLTPLTDLGTLSVNADGTFAGGVSIPAGLPAGDYVVQTNCVTTSAQVRSVSVGVTVRTGSLLVCKTDSGAVCGSVVQRPKTGVIKLPKSLEGGRNLLLSKRVRLNSGQFADVKVLCAPMTRAAPIGDIAYCATTRKGKTTYVLVRPNMRLRATVRFTAPATRKYAAYRFTKSYRVR